MEAFYGSETPVMSSSKAAGYTASARPLEDAAGYISSTYLYVYPPGIPLIVPGEEITKEIIALIKGYEQAGLTVLGFEETPESRESDQGKESGGAWEDYFVLWERVHPVRTACLNAWPQIPGLACAR